MDGARVDMKVVAATWALLASSLVACSATSGGTAGAADHHSGDIQLLAICLQFLSFCFPQSVSCSQ